MPTYIYIHTYTFSIRKDCSSCYDSYYGDFEAWQGWLRICPLSSEYHQVAGHRTHQCRSLLVCICMYVCMYELLYVYVKKMAVWRCSCLPPSSHWAAHSALRRARYTLIHTYKNDNALTCGYAGSGILQGNMVLLNSANLTSSTFAGPCAGRFPTANSVMNDLIRISLVSYIYVCIYIYVCEIFLEASVYM